MVDICCVGHITADKVVTPRSATYMPGGTAWYFSHAVAKLDISYLLVTALAPAEMNYVALLQDRGINIQAGQSAHTVHFENVYGDNPDERSQKVLYKADAFTVEQLRDVKATIFHLGPLLADDMGIDFIKTLAARGLVSLDVQGFLRKVVNNRVYAADWPEKQAALKYVTILKADQSELRALTGYKDPRKGMKLLASWGVKEIVITNGSMGSVIYFNDVFYHIPAYKPNTIRDATGCGDTYMAGYLYQRVKGIDLQHSGKFAAAMASLKMEVSGPFTGTESDVTQVLKNDFP